jgi:hypothetical protein
VVVGCGVDVGGGSTADVAADGATDAADETPDEGRTIGLTVLSPPHAATIRAMATARTETPTTGGRGRANMARSFSESRPIGRAFVKPTFAFAGRYRRLGGSLRETAAT